MLDRVREAYMYGGRIRRSSGKSPTKRSRAAALLREEHDPAGDCVRQRGAECREIPVLQIALGIWLSAFIPASAAFACGGVFDAACNVTHGGLSPSNIAKQTQKAGQDAGNTVAKAGQDVANAINELQANVLSGPTLERAIIASHNTAINGAMPIPPQIRQQLTGYASEDSMNRARYKIGDNGFANLARLLEQGGVASAVTLIDIVVFSGPSEAADLSIWAHELTHVDRYRAWGVHSFAVQYTRNWHSVEDPAYPKGDGFLAWQQQHLEDNGTPSTGHATINSSPPVANSASGGLACRGPGFSMVPAGWQGCAAGSNNVQYCSGAPFPGDPRFGQWVTLNRSCQ
jgi:hypothetical protein